MQFHTKDYVADAAHLVREIARLLPDYVPGVDTGQADYTDRRTCWTKAMKSVLQAMARHHNVDSRTEDFSEFGTERQLKVFWKKRDALLLCAVSGWGDRSELEASFVRLLSAKSPQKLIVYTCAKWQEAVLDQLTAALIRYPFHIQGEEYIAVNLVGTEGKLHATSCRVPHAGDLTLAEAAFTPVAGSPFTWRLVHQ